jgi:3-phosphoshikimate 1-carboxyvinyltransferase
MIANIFPSSLQGNIRAPRSKSDMQRACAAALLHHGTTRILDPGRSNDDLAALDVIAKLGATVVDKGDEIEITSKGVHPVSDQLHCGESGLGIRMFTPIAALSGQPLTISGSGSLVNRPMNFFDEIFPQLNIAIQSQQGKLPLSIKGPLVPQTITVDGSLSSQFLTGLLMAFSAANAKGVTIHVKDLKSKPYIDLTLSVLSAFGMKTPWVVQYEQFVFEDNDHHAPEGALDYAVEGDWSGAAFLFVAGAIAGEITIQGMKADSVQADRKILEAITDSGAALEWNEGVYKVSPGTLKAFVFDATECPDLFPPLVALAAYCEGVTTIRGALRLTHKESNRALTLKDVFGKMGISITLEGDIMKVHGGTGVKGAHVHSHHDHRIAMAAAVAALRADGPITIDDAEAIDKSYPEFYVDLRRLGTEVALRKF